MNPDEVPPKVELGGAIGRRGMGSKIDIARPARRAVAPGVRAAGGVGVRTLTITETDMGVQYTLRTEDDRTATADAFGVSLDQVLALVAPFWVGRRRWE